MEAREAFQSFAMRFLCPYFISRGAIIGPPDGLSVPSRDFGERPSRPLAVAIGRTKPDVANSQAARRNRIIGVLLFMC